MRVRTYGFPGCLTRPPGTSTRHHPHEPTTSKPVVPEDVLPTQCSPRRILFATAGLLCKRRHLRRPENGRLTMTIAGLRRTSISLAVLVLAILGLSASASAAPTFTFKTAALPIPGFPHTGDFLGAGAVIQVEGTISGTEYGGFPPPLTGVKYWAPAGAKLHLRGSPPAHRARLNRADPGRVPRHRLRARRVPSVAWLRRRHSS